MSTVDAEPEIVPVNFQPRDASALQTDVDYALTIARAYIYQAETLGLALPGLRLLELGPGINFGAQLLLVGMGVEMALADRFLAPWDPAYHPVFYRALMEQWDGETSALAAAVERGGYDGLIRLLPYPAEALAGVADGSFDLVLSNAVLEHVYDLPAVAREMARITRIGGYNSHQIDFRDHRTFETPLEFLLEEDAAFAAEFAQIAGERGNRRRPREADAFFTEAGFEILSVEVTAASTDEYLAAFMPRLRAAPSSYRNWPEDDLHNVGSKFVMRRSDDPALVEKGRRLRVENEELRRAHA